MPHVIIEFSANAGDWGEPEKITKAVHEALCSVGHLPAEAVKTRAIRHDVFHIGEHAEGKGFITVLIRTRPGREDHVLVEISESARAAVLAHVRPVAGRTLAVSVEVQMMNPVAVLHAKV
jgi:5-carboxymethyl-2-hydroxymuconate isomerase